MSGEQILKLFQSPTKVVNLGLESFADSLRSSAYAVEHIRYKPPLAGDVDLAETVYQLNQTHESKIREANETACARILSAKPKVTGIGTALHDIPGMHKDLFLHAGPPVSWEEMSGPTKGAVLGGLIYEGRAKDVEEANKLASNKTIQFAPCHHHHTVGPMAGVVTPSMPVWIFENETFGNKAYITLNEGLGKVLRYGAYGAEVNQRLKWMENVLAPALKAVIAQLGALDMKNLIAQALQMGDEGHNRNRAGTSLFFREIAPEMFKLDFSNEDKEAVLRFIHSNDHFFLNLSMGAAKCSVDPIKDIPYCSLIYTMARNGTDFGIRISALGDRWFSAPAPVVDGLYLPGYTADDAALDIGDSVITETIGIGGFAMAAAPAIVKFVGGTPQDALHTTEQMYAITTMENDTYQIPALNFRGTPTGIDLLKIIQSGILPAINTGIAHKQPGIGMVGAGLVKPPAQCFVEAAKAFAKMLQS